MLTKIISPYKPTYQMGGGYRAPYQWQRPGDIADQAALDKFLETAPKIGEWVTFKNAGAITTTYMLSYVIDIDRNFDTLKSDHMGNKQTHLLIQLGNMSFEHGWCRWADASDYRRASAEDMRQLKVDDAVLQDYIQKFTPELARSRCRV